MLDMDGVIIDSEPLWQDAEIEVFGAVGVPLDRELCRETTGLRMDEAVAYWYRRVPWEGPTPTEVGDRLLRRVTELIAERAEPLPGLDDLLDRLDRHGVPVALASSSPLVLIEAVLDRFGVADRLAAVHSAEGEPYGKPHPAVYLTTAEQLGVDPAACVAVEDSANGVVAAKAARMGCIAVPAAVERDDPRFGIADATVDSLQAIDDALLGRLLRF